MKTVRVLLVLAIFLIAIADLTASGPVGVYGIIEKVIFEPNETSPERIQVWGAFAFVDGGPSRPGATSPAQPGYLYFTLPMGNGQSPAAARAEWADFKTLAGTGQAVGFGNWFLMGVFSGLASAPGSGSGRPVFADLNRGTGFTDVRVRPPSEPLAGPAVYGTNAGIVKLTEQGSHAEIVRQLKEALKTQ